MKWLTKFLTAENEASSKRLICFLLVIVLIIALFLLMYIKIELANKDLVGDILENIFWLILIFGGFIAAEPFLNKWVPGRAKKIINENVEEQVINEEPQTVKRKR